jgi:hypothetical protein
MDLCPADYESFPPDGPKLTCDCTVQASTPGRSSVFGDLVYAGSSSLCLAARHAGVISGWGGQIVVWSVPTPAEDPPFPSVLRNGIQSYGSPPLGTSFRVSSVGGEPAALPEPSSPGMRVMEFCPQNYQEFPMDGPPLTCGCTVEASTPALPSRFAKIRGLPETVISQGDHRVTVKVESWSVSKRRRKSAKACGSGRPSAVSAASSSK